MISVIIPAHNEEQTIADVIRAALQHPLVAEVIVVSDGSTDRTVERAKQASARVIALPGNQGKGAAMNIGVSRAKGDLLVFLDADLIGFKPEFIDGLVQPLLQNECSMTVLRRNALFDRIYYWRNLAIGGERALRRSTWEMVPAEDRRGFQIEIALNHHVLAHGMRIDIIPAPGLHHRFKTTKYGLLKGIRGEMRMFGACTAILWKYYIRVPAKDAWEQVRKTLQLSK